ncbi:hypothetical protein JCM10212_000025 [Sporobolomyces blumeae]
MSTIVPRYKPSTARRLPPAKLALFRSVVSHPPAPYAVSGHQQATAQAPTKGKGKAKQQQTPRSPSPLVGPHTLLYSTSPRPLIPLTTSPVNHKLWNPPAPDSAATRSVEKDESGRLAKFSSRFRTTANTTVDDDAARTASNGTKKGDDADAGLFGIEGDLSWLEGVTVQSPGGALGKRDIVGPAKQQKKGKK